nr:DUF5134 domain-containing protein [Spelaeicoccus albus]
MPTWVQVSWIAIYVLVVLVHVHHAWSLTGLSRVWHLSHILMALGMIDMFWPTTMPFGQAAGVTAFVVLTTAVVAIGVGAVVSQRGWRAWTFSAIDLGGMIYMFAMMSYRLAPLTLAYALWSVVEAALWATGLAHRLLRLHGAGTGTNDQTDAVTSHKRWGLQLSLAAMIIGMAYMFVAMQYGIPTSGMHGMALEN